MKRQLTLFLSICIVLGTTSCVKNASDDQHPLQLDSPPALRDMMDKMNPIEKAHFSTEDRLELNTLINELDDNIDFRSGLTVEVPAGSVDAISDAIVEAGEDGQVILKAGEHLESNTIIINSSVKIVGEKGAIVKTNTQTVAITGVLQPAIHIMNQQGVVVRGIEFLNQDPLGGTAILIENAPRTQIIKNSFSAFEIGVFIEKSERVIVNSNTFETSLGWTNGPGLPGYGVAVVNGKNARIINNVVSSSLFGIWACDGAGWYLNNKTFGNYVGMILCKVPQAFPLPSGEITGSIFSANNWLTIFNESYDNLNAGFLVIDGANRNFLSSNFAKNNGTYDIELVGDSERFGFLTPTSAANRVYSRSDMTIKDCGEGNKVRGGIMVDNEIDPCF